MHLSGKFLNKKCTFSTEYFSQQFGRVEKSGVVLGGLRGTLNLPAQKQMINLIFMQQCQICMEEEFCPCIFSTFMKNVTVVFCTSQERLSNLSVLILSLYSLFRNSTKSCKVLFFKKFPV